MSNFTINFSNPWFLLLLIPAVLFTLIPLRTLDNLLEQEQERGFNMRCNIPGFNAIYKIVEGQYQEEINSIIKERSY